MINDDIMKEKGGLEMDTLVNKEGLKILGSLIKLNRLNQKMSQQALCEGICVPSYLSKIENGEVIPSLDMIKLLFDELAIDYLSDYEWLKQMKEQIDDFFEELNLNGFIHLEQLFKNLKVNESKFIHSPLVVDYYLAKLAYTCGSLERDGYNEAYLLLNSIESLLSKDQRYKFYFYQGIDALYFYHNYEQAKEYFELARQYLETGRLYELLAIVSYKRGNYFESYQAVLEARRRYLQEGNLISMIGLYEFEGMLAYKTGSIVDAIEQCERAISFAKKMNRLDLAVTPWLTKTFIHYSSDELHLVKMCLNEIKKLQDDLGVTWPIFDIHQLMIKIVDSNQKMSDLFDIYNQALEEMKPALGLMIFGLTQGEVVIDDLSNLIRSYTQGTSRFLFIDEWVFSLLKSYHLSKRQYKEVVQLLEKGHL